MTRKWFPLLGLGFAIAGADKVLGLGAYDRLFEKWGWSNAARQLVGASELAGGALIASERLRHVGGWLLTAVSAAMLGAEIDRGERDLALPRFALMMAATTALWAGRHQR
jgi:DoxX-like family